MEKSVVNINLLDESKLDDNDDDNETAIFFDSDKFLNKIAKSYNYDVKNINEQFNKDFTRTKITFNNKIISNKEKIIKKIKQYGKYTFLLNDCKYTFDDIIFMLCTQASFSFSFAFMNKKYTDIDKNLFLTSDKSQFIITNTNDTFTMQFDATFVLKNIINGSKYKNINIQTNIDFVYKNKQYELCKYGIILWNCPNNC